MTEGFSLLTVHSLLLGKQIFSISGWCSATLMLDTFRQFGRNVGENAFRQDSDSQVQYKRNETEQHPETR